MGRLPRWLAGLFAVLLATFICNGLVWAAVSDLAADFSLASNPNGVWTYGYMSSANSTYSNNEFIQTGVSAGFVPYNITEPMGLTGDAWGSDAQGLGFPYNGNWGIPNDAATMSTFFPSINDFPTSEGENPDYPNGVVGGHGAVCSFCTGWYAVKYTATSTGPVDIEVKNWQTGIYPNIPPNPLYGGNTRPSQVLFQKESSGTYTDILRSPQVSRHGWVNLTGTPQHTTANAATPGDPFSFATAEDEIDAAIRSSANPNLYRLTNLQLNAGESIIVSMAPHYGDNNNGFNAMNIVVRTGADRETTTRWDLSDDWSVHGSTSTGIGPDAAWSYGFLEEGSFAPYDKILFGQVGENPSTPGRDNHGWQTQAPGWFIASAPEAETGPITPGMMKDFNGYNFSAVDGASSATHDWPAGKVIMHTPNSMVDASRTSAVRWTAPRNMSVDASGGVWRVTTYDGTDRRHEFDLLLNGISIASGTVDELGFDCGAGDTNSACQAAFDVSSVNVLAGDTLELMISPLVEAGGTPGDYNENGEVDAADYSVWRDALTAGSTSLANDSTPGTVDETDFLYWRDHFGETGGGGISASESFVGVDFTVVESGLGSGAGLARVPEPSSLVVFLATFGLAQVVLNRTRRRTMR